MIYQSRLFFKCLPFLTGVTNLDKSTNLSFTAAAVGKDSIFEVPSLFLIAIILFKKKEKLNK